MQLTSIGAERSTALPMPEPSLDRERVPILGAVFQFYNLIPSVTAREDVGLVTQISKDPLKAEKLSPAELCW
jgi:ABC-type lipoprotein export system ATPase subunit